MSQALKSLVAVRSQRARGVLAALETHARSVDRTPWVRIVNGTRQTIRPSDVAVDLRVAGSRLSTWRDEPSGDE